MLPPATWSLPQVDYFQSIKGAQDFLLTEEADKSHGTSPVSQLKLLQQWFFDSWFWLCFVWGEKNLVAVQQREKILSLSKSAPPLHSLCARCAWFSTLKLFFFPPHWNWSLFWVFFVFSSMECTFCTPASVYVAIWTWTELYGRRVHEVLIWIWDSRRLVNYTERQFRDLLFVLFQIILLDHHFKLCCWE